MSLEKVAIEDIGTHVAEQSTSHLLLLGGVIIGAILFWFFVRRVWLAFFAEKIRAWLTGDNGNYQSADDELLQIVEQIELAKDPYLLNQLEEYCTMHPKRVRGWQEYAHVLQGVFGRTRDACELLERASHQVHHAQDKALLLYRAAVLRRDRLDDGGNAQRLFRDAAQRFPKTTYGKLAKEQCSD